MSLELFHRNLFIDSPILQMCMNVKRVEFDTINMMQASSQWLKVKF